MKSETEKGVFRADLAVRIKQCAQRVGGGNELARKAGIPRRTLENYLSGDNEPKASGLAAIAEAASVSAAWLLTGGDQPPADQPAASAPPLNLEALAGAVRIVEGWLDAHDRVMPPSKKAEVVSMIYELIIEDIEEGKPPLSERRIEKILRLVA